MGGEEVIPGETQGLALPTGQEQRILVLVRLRPLDERELARDDVSDWECVNNTTIVYKNSLVERSMYPAGYTFDKVFGKDCATKQVYEEGAKEVTLSVVGGINSSIFAYGQTSSGKTYTMRGITEYAAEDIYDYIDRHQEREFVLKFSAIEIYNESVRDLLSSDTTPLRLLDDPEKGTVVERLTEEMVTDLSHLMELLAVCEAQRQIGETSLNETSSRSHQILRLTIESSAREYLGAGNSSTLSASVNFVDLAGSERASQTLSGGARLKEGCHINRSLLTLGTVIRKLSKGKNGHIPYRDSKLTRILQNSLGGNARTAIICTMSPARSHVEQSRNTLLFASCAKEVSTNAQVNCVVSDKALVKQLQRELARLESEMKSIGSTSSKLDSATLLREKEQIIEHMDREIRELTRQRDLAQSRVTNLLQSVGEDQASRLHEYSEIESSYISHPLQLDVGLGTYNRPENVDIPRVSNSYPQYFHPSENPEENFMLDDNNPKFVGADPCRCWEENAQKIDEETEDTCREVRCIEMEESSTNRTTESDVSLLGPEEKEGELSLSEALDEPEESFPFKAVRCIPTEESPEEEKLSITEVIGEVAVPSPWKEDKESEPIDKDQTYALKQKILELQKTINYLVSLYTVEQSPSSSEDGSISRASKFNRSTSCKARLMSMPYFPALEKAEHRENISTNWSDKTVPGRHGRLSKFYSARTGNFYWKDFQTSTSAASLESQSIKEYDAEDNSSIYEQNENAWFEKAEQTPTAASGNIFPGRRAQELSELNYGAQIGKLRGRNSETSISSGSDDSQSTRGSDTEDSGIHEFVSEQHEMDKHQSQKKFGDYLVQENTTESETEESTEKAKDDGLDSVQGASQPLFNWLADFERQRKEIIELWNACNVPLVHRTYFFLLFKGDPSDAVYMEVELRRLSFLKGGNITKESYNSSLRSIYRERDMLSKQIHQKFPRKEREQLYEKWGIALNTKQRSLQIARRLWSNTKDMNHINDSAALVAKLIGFVQPNQAPKEIFGLSFSSGSSSRRSYSWRPGRSSFGL